VTGAAVGAAPGQTPAGVVTTKVVLTGLVVGVDPTAYTVQLVNPSGGMIQTVSVPSPEGRQSMKLIKVGDTITAVVSEAIAVAIEPAT
jgi:exosome complex RNA-binding protein Rrp4